MKTILTVLALASLAPAARGAELNLSFPGRGEGGQVSYAVFDDAAAWKARKPARLSGALAVGEDRIRLNLPPGSYAVMAFYDANRDKRLNTLPIGLPTEPYGFSNNSRGMFGPPSWSAAVFTLSADGAQQTIRLK